MNILFITRLYPSDCYDNGQTGMGHYLCREMKKAGHDVRVIHEDMRYCKRWSAFERDLPDTRRFTLEDVPVSFIKLNRPLPKYRWLPGKEAAKAAEFILKETRGFVPDVVFAFFCYDQWKVIERLRPYFGCPIVPIFHNCDVKFSDKQVGKILDASPVAGGVSGRILDKLHRVRPAARTFMCYGGAPNDVSAYYTGEKHNDVFSVVFAGMLIPLKNVDVTLQALAALKDRYNFRFDVYGEGEEEQNLKHLAVILGINERVNFHGKVPREEVLAAMGRADCFAMVSSPETFGLTYLEAMACGCYTIGSRGEGIDGVLVDGENGTLVTPDSVEELTAALELYFKAPDRVREMQMRAVETASALTEEKVAAMMLEDALR